jgi:hypothetical protein
MPTRYIIDRERRLIISSAWDRVSHQEILAHRNRLKTDPDFDPSYNQLIDGRAVTALDLSVDEAREIASTSPFSSPARRAIVATDLTILSIARLAEAYSGPARGREEVRVFHDYSAALEWLGIEPEFG